MVRRANGSERLAQVVVVHGIGHQYGGEASLASSRVPALRDGLTRAGVSATVDVTCAFYGDVFRAGWILIR